MTVLFKLEAEQFLHCHPSFAKTDLTIRAEATNLFQTGQVGRRRCRLIRTLKSEQSLVGLLWWRDYSEKSRRALDVIFAIELESHFAFSLDCQLHVGCRILGTVLGRHLLDENIHVRQWSLRGRRRRWCASWMAGAC